MQPSMAKGVGNVTRVRRTFKRRPSMLTGGGDVGKAASRPIRCFSGDTFPRSREQVRATKVDNRKAKNYDSDAKSDGEIKPEGGGSDEDSDPDEAVIRKAMKASMPKTMAMMKMMMTTTTTTTTTVSSNSLFMIQNLTGKLLPIPRGISQEEPCDTEDDGTVDWEFDGAGLSLSTDASDAKDSVKPDASASVETYGTISRKQSETRDLARPRVETEAHETQKSSHTSKKDCIDEKCETRDKRKQTASPILYKPQRESGRPQAGENGRQRNEAEDAGEPWDLRRRCDITINNMSLQLS
ncbi:hypothetical protein DFH94DRAFT_820804 [Russula ochroleuca]|uniref:Uncharacterized protein n=1 Tax=Russula ochroleuca TaxID=152965 RepID=A0A9P5N1V0_9AGAM|nr:hypothetical protein DFH94DRAFT_820804 [Russula ochroleuca]